MSKRTLAAVVFLLALTPGFAWGCACGCGIFDVGGASMMPDGPGGNVWVEYDFMNQNRNWNGSSSSSADNNDDKRIRSDFYILGGQYMFNRSWGVMAQVPYTDRYFKTTDHNTGNIVGSDHSAFGDVKLQGIYSGFEPDMSTGVTFGLKLPTGDYSHFDRDTAIGSGSTNLLLGGYHQGRITKDNRLSWFINGQLDSAFLTKSDYRPGDEADVALGTYYDAGPVGGMGRLSPLLQLLGSYRLRDSGLNADRDDSGYERLLISPGMEYDVRSFKFYADVEVPVYQRVNGNQLVAPLLYKFILGYSF